MEHWCLRNSYAVHVPTLDRTWSDQNEFGIHYQLLFLMFLLNMFILNVRSMSMSMVC